MPGVGGAEKRRAAGCPRRGADRSACLSEASLQTGPRRPSIARNPSEAESFSGVPEQRSKTCPIKAQSTAIARAMARICNAERVHFGVVSGHERKTLSLLWHRHHPARTVPTSPTQRSVFSPSPTAQQRTHTPRATNRASNRLNTRRVFPSKICARSASSSCGQAST